MSMIFLIAHFSKCHCLYRSKLNIFGSKEPKIAIELNYTVHI